MCPGLLLFCPDCVFVCGGGVSGASVAIGGGGGVGVGDGGGLAEESGGAGTGDGVSDLRILGDGADLVEAVLLSVEVALEAGGRWKGGWR